MSVDGTLYYISVAQRDETEKKNNDNFRYYFSW